MGHSGFDVCAKFSILDKWMQIRVTTCLQTMIARVISAYENSGINTAVSQAVEDALNSLMQHFR